jgi:hypothetical protein
MRILLIVAIFLFTGIGATRAQKVYEQRDKFDGTTQYYTRLRISKLDSGGIFSYQDAVFNFQLLRPVNSKTPYLLRVSTSTPDWIFIPAGGSLQLKIDGQENNLMTLFGAGSVRGRGVVSSDEVSEECTYLVTQDELEAIGRAKHVEFRILGDKQNVTGSWKPDLIADAGGMSTKGPQLISELQTSANQIPSQVAAVPPPSCPPLSDATAAPPKIGVRYVPVDQKVADLLHFPSATGAFVALVVPGSVAEATGIRRGDVILRIGEKTIASFCDVPDSLMGTEKGSKISITIRRDGAESVVQAQF